MQVALTNVDVEGILAVVVHIPSVSVVVTVLVATPPVAYDTDIDETARGTPGTT
jgi:hypothetical protein